MNRTTARGRLRFPLTVKFALLLLALGLLASGAQYLIILTTSSRNLIERLEHEVFLLLSSTDWAISLLLEKGDIGSIQRLLENFGASPRLREVRLYDPSERILAASNQAEVGKKIEEKAVRAVLASQALRAVSRVSRGLAEPEYSVAIPIRGKEYSTERSSDIGAVLFVRPNAEYAAGEVLAFVNSLVYQVLVATIFIILIFSIFIYAWVLRPLRTFMIATGRIQNGEYDHQVRIEQRDEFGSFAAAFNIMQREIRSKTAALTDYSGRLEAEVLETNERLLQAQKMEAVGRLAGGIAHDFNNILTGISGYSDLLLEVNTPDQENHKFAQEIRKAAKRAAALTQQLLAFSRKQILQPQVLDLNGLIKSLERMLTRLLEEHVILETDLEPELWLVKVDPSQFDQVLMNLVINARDAMPDGGRLQIETRNVQLDEEYAKKHIGTTVAGDYVLVAVSDDGTGMDKEVMSHLFEPFFTTKEAGKGTGLGLSTVYGIVRQSGGNIWVYSEPGKGTSFKIYLPRAEQAKAASGEGRMQQSPAREGQRETILIAEDDETVRALLTAILQAKGYRVLVATDGEQALRVFQKHSGEIDLAITDVIMPKMNGRELADQMRGIRPDLKVVFTSGYTSNIIVHQGVLDPGVVLLEKPIAAGTLLKKVREVLDERA